MTKAEREYTIINNSVSTLAILCAADHGKIIDILTGYLWDEEEAIGIRAIKQPHPADAQPCGVCGGTGKATPTLDVEEFYKD